VKYVSHSVLVFGSGLILIYVRGFLWSPFSQFLLFYSFFYCFMLFSLFLCVELLGMNHVLAVGFCCVAAVLLLWKFLYLPL
jgi:hypothetical protein